MKNPVTIREVFIFIAFLISAYFAFIKKWDNVQLQEDKIRSEEKVKSLEQNDKAKALLIDSFKTNAKVLEGIVDYQKNNPKIIEKKYVEIRNDVLNLPVDDKIEYLARRLSKKNNN